MLERVVDLVDIAPDRLATAHVPQQPQLLLVADVREIPDQRGHQLGVLTYELVIVDRVGQPDASVTRAAKLCGHLLPQCLHGLRHDQEILPLVVGRAAAPCSARSRSAAIDSATSLVKPVSGRAGIPSSMTCRAASAIWRSARPSRAAGSHRSATGRHTSTTASTIRGEDM